MPRKKANSRGYSQRKVDTREVRQRFLIVCARGKNSETIYDELLSKQSTAIKNAENLLKQYEFHNPAKDNPSTAVHVLVKELNRFIS